MREDLLDDRRLVKKRQHLAPTPPPTITLQNIGFSDRPTDPMFAAEPPRATLRAGGTHAIRRTRDPIGAALRFTPRPVDSRRSSTRARRRRRQAVGHLEAQPRAAEVVAEARPAANTFNCATIASIPPRKLPLTEPGRRRSFGRSCLKSLAQVPHRSCVAEPSHVEDAIARTTRGVNLELARE